MPCPKSPHGCDTDPTGSYIVGSGKLAAVIPVFSFDKMQKAIADKKFDGDYEGIPVLKYEEVLRSEKNHPFLAFLKSECGLTARDITKLFSSGLFADEDMSKTRGYFGNYQVVTVERK